MKVETIIARIARIDSLLAELRLGSALSELRPILPSNANLQREYDDLTEASQLMSKYCLDGAVDPQRQAMFDDMAERVKTLARSALRDFRLKNDDNTVYFSTLRYLQSRGESISSLSEKLLDLNRQLDMPFLSDNKIARDNESGRPLQALLEEIELNLFNTVWTTYILTHDDSEAISRLLDNPAVKSYQKEHVVAALMLGEIDWHDERRQLILMNQYGDISKPESLRLKSLTSLLIGLWVHKDHHLSRKAKARFDALTELPGWVNDVKSVWMELVRARDTERVTRKIKDELLPELMKLRPDIEKRMGKVSSDAIPIEENPEWQEIIDKSGISDRLKELSDIQEEGGDVMMGTFDQLKSFPFFRDVANWFLPFHAGHSTVNTARETSQSFFDLLEESATMCDNDKFSLVCAFSMMPASQREMFKSQFQGSETHIAEMLAGEISDSKRRANGAVAKHVRNIYRFFKLFRRKGEFFDIFTTPINLASLPLLSTTLGDAETIELVAEFYFKRGYYADALDLFERLVKISDAVPQHFQKMGYCCQKLGMIEDALKHYRRSELLKSDSIWTLRRIAACQRMLGHYDEALETFQKIEKERPEDAGIALMIGHCLLSLNRTEEALKAYYKVDFIEHGSSRAMRPLAWTLLLSGDYDKSRVYYNKILADNPDFNDYINSGHLEMLSSDFRKALEYYKKAYSLLNNDISRFDKIFEPDLNILVSAGVDPVAIGIVRDAVIS